MNCLYEKTFCFEDDSKNFRELFSVFCKVYVLHGKMEFIEWQDFVHESERAIVP